MKYEKTNDRSFLGKFRFHARLEKGASADCISRLDDFMHYRVRGEWTRTGNDLYLVELADIFHIRIAFDEQLKLIREAGRFPVVVRPEE